MKIRVPGLGTAGRPSERRWAVVSLVDSVGSGMIAPATVLYFTHFVGLPLSSVGAGLALAGLAALCLAPLAGPLTDRFGPRRTLMGYWLLSAVAYGAHAFVNGWAGFVTVTAAALVSGYSTKSVKQAFLADLAEDEDRVRLMAMQRAIRNAGLAIGGMLCTVALTTGTTGYVVIVQGNALSYAVAAGIVMTIPIGRAHRHEPPARPPRLFSYLPALQDRTYMALTVLDFLIGFQATALQVALPLWVAYHTRAPTAVVGGLITLNMLLTVFFQVRVARGRHGLAGTPQLYVRSAVLFCGAAMSYVVAGRTASVLAVVCLTAAVVLHTATELYGSTAEWTVATELADPTLRGTYLAVFWSGNSLQQAVGPVIVTSLLAAGTVWLWPVLTVLFGVGSLLSAYVVRRGRDRLPEWDAAVTAG